MGALDWLGQRGIPAHAFRADFEIPGPVECSADHPVPRRPVHRHAFPRQVRFIQSRLPLFNHAVHRNPLPGFHHHQIPGTNFIQRNGALRAVMPYQRLLGNQLHQPFYGGIRFPIRAAFKVFPQGNQGDDHGRRFKIQLHSLHTETLPHPRYQQIQPIQKSGAGTDGDQGIHIGRQRHKLPHAVYQIMPVQPQDGARQNALCPPIHPEPPTPFRDGPVPHGAHGQIHQRNQQQNGPNETGAARFLLFQPFLPLRSGKRLLLPVRQAEAGFPPPELSAPWRGNQVFQTRRSSSPSANSALRAPPPPILPRRAPPWRHTRRNAYRKQDSSFLPLSLKRNV